MLQVEAREYGPLATWLDMGCCQAKSSSVAPSRYSIEQSSYSVEQEDDDENISHCDTAAASGGSGSELTDIAAFKPERTVRQRPDGNVSVGGGVQALLEKYGTGKRI